LPLAVWADGLATRRLHLASITSVLLGSVVLGLAWRWIFLMNVPVGAVVLLITALVLPPDASRPHVRSMSNERERVVAAFLSGRLPAGRVEAELKRVSPGPAAGSPRA
jgi:predicted MFS family arabinose efflux permease